MCDRLQQCVIETQGLQRRVISGAESPNALPVHIALFRPLAASHSCCLGISLSPSLFLHLILTFRQLGDSEVAERAAH